MMSFAAGDCEGFELLYRRHSGSIYRFFYFGTHGDKALAAELFHDVWMTVVRGRLRYTNDINFTDWLFHSAWARLHDHLRLHSLERDPDGLRSSVKESTVINMADFVNGNGNGNGKAEAVNAGCVSVASVEVPEQPLLVETIKNLSAEQKEVVLLRYCFSMSVQDIADFIDVSKSSVERVANETASLLRQNIAVEVANGDQFNG